MAVYFDEIVEGLVSRSTRTEKIWQDVKGSTHFSPPRVTTFIRVIGNEKLREFAKTLPYASCNNCEFTDKELVTVGGPLKGTLRSYAYVHIWEA